MYYIGKIMVFLKGMYKFTLERLNSIFSSGYQSPPLTTEAKNAVLVPVPFNIEHKYEI